MPKLLTGEQLEALRAVPLSGMPNKLRIALALAKARQAEVCEETGIAPPNLSNLVNGKYGSVTIETGQKLADYFGCTTDDLFPRQGVAA